MQSKNMCHTKNQEILDWNEFLKKSTDADMEMIQVLDLFGKDFKAIISKYSNKKL
jgi:hypothetical protein